MVTAVTVEQVTRIAVRAAVTAVSAEGGTVAVRDGDVLRLNSTEHYNPDLQHTFQLLALASPLPVCHAARTGERLLLRSRQAAVARFPQVRLHQELTDRSGVPIVSAAVLPLKVDDRLLGSLTVTWSRERDFSEGDVELLEALAALASRAVDRVEQAVERDRALTRAEVLARAGDLLTAGLDAQAVCEALVALLVPDLAQQADVELVGGQGRSASAGVSALAGRLPRQSRPRGTLPPAASGAPSAAAHAKLEPRLNVTGSDVTGSDVTGSGSAALGRVTSRCAVPLTAAGRRVGTLTAVRQTGPPFTSVERQLLQAVAERAALAVDNAVLFAEQREISLALQQALLTAPPEPDHLHVVVRYQPALHAAVGGDWYDAIVTPDGATVLVVGDVVGHDARAAATMGQLRALLRAVAYTGQHSPAAVLASTEQAAVGLSVSSLATAVVARIERDPHRAGGRLLRWSNAGHLPPVLLRADGTARLLEVAPELMLGVDENALRTDTVLQLADGDTLLLYTDGLVERRNSTLDAGLRLLLEHVRDLAGAPPQVLCDALLGRLLRDGAEDDVALLAVRLHPEGEARPASGGPHRLPGNRR